MNAYLGKKGGGKENQRVRSCLPMAEAKPNDDLELSKSKNDEKINPRAKNGATQMIYLHHIYSSIWLLYRKFIIKR